MKRENYSKDQWGKILAHRWDALDELHRSGVIDEHPGKAGWNADSAVLRKATRDGLTGNVGEAKEIEPHDHTDDYATDDPGNFPGRPAGPERNGGGTAMDAVLEELAIRRSGHSNPEEAIRQARLRRSGSTSATVRAMIETVPGYDRLK